jgi:hypothetical protein
MGVSGGRRQKRILRWSICFANRADRSPVPYGKSPVIGDFLPSASSFNPFRKSLQPRRLGLRRVLGADLCRQHQGEAKRDLIGLTSHLNSTGAYDFGSQGCRFEPCRVQIKSQRRFAGYFVSAKLRTQIHCYRFVIGFLNFTRLRDSTCADNGEYFACLKKWQVHNSELRPRSQSVNTPETFEPRGRFR